MVDDTWDAGDPPTAEPGSPDPEVAAKSGEEVRSGPLRLVERLQAGRDKALRYPLPDRVAVVTAVVVVILAGGWLILRVSTTEPDPAPMTAGETLDAFFEARESGDCERLLDITSEASWSDGGARSREDFVEQCAEALEGSEPHTPDVHWLYMDTQGRRYSRGGAGPYRGDVEPHGGHHDIDAEYDQAVVVDTPRYIGDSNLDHTGEVTYRMRDEAERPEGRLVREGGRWRVVTDDVVLPIGLGLNEVILNYLQAWHQGDCEELLDYVSADVWSAGDQGWTRDRFVEACARAAEARQAGEAPHLHSVEASFHDGAASATVTFNAPGGEAETARLVRTGLRWKLDLNEDLSAEVSPGTLFTTLRSRELASQMLDEVVAGGETCSDHFDDRTPDRPQPRGSPGTLLRREFCGGITGAVVTVHEWADAAEASSAAEEMAEQLAEETISPATGSSVSERRPNQAADIPGMPDAYGVRAVCYIDGCVRLWAFLPLGPMVVEVEVSLLGDFSEATLDDMSEILAEQRDLLDPH